MQLKLGTKLTNLQNLKNQIMTTNVWLNQEWSDYKLKWDPSEYGGIEDINLPAEQIWLPDIVLYNSAEGNFALTIMTKAKVRYDGSVIWTPPAIFRSFCQIDITYFPFDLQNCTLKFGSWTFGTKIDLRHANDTSGLVEHGTDLSEYYQNVEWDIMSATARRNYMTYLCCPNDFYPDVTFYFLLRRKPLFYTVNLILPCVGITILSFLVFYLPSDSGEKVTLTISILLSLVFFLSVLIETIPSTSIAMPLLCKYIVFTMILITVSVCATVCVLNIHFRTPSTHSMPNWIKRWCVEILPKYLFVNVPQYETDQQTYVILPEQLIYAHNQAYLNNSALNNNNNHKNNYNDKPEMVQLQSSAWTQVVKSSDSNNNDNDNVKSKIKSKGKNKKCSVYPKQELDKQRYPPYMAEMLMANNMNPASGSLFLPYLQSEAARRLQLQRSRSSERDPKSSTSDRENNTNFSSNTMDHRYMNQLNNNNTDGDIFKISGGLSDKESHRANNYRNSRDNRQSTSIDIQENKSKNKPIKSNNRRRSLLSWLLNRDDRPNRKTSGSRRDPKLASKISDANINKVHDQELRQMKFPHQESSSSIENDYQYHRHFQARASICSTNMWRVGPQRLSAMPANYPTYYRPLIHLAQVKQLDQTSSNQHPRTLHGSHIKEVASFDGSIKSGPSQSRSNIHNGHHSSFKAQQPINSMQALSTNLQLVRGGPSQPPGLAATSSIYHSGQDQQEGDTTPPAPTPPPPLAPFASSLSADSMSNDTGSSQHQLLAGTSGLRNIQMRSAQLSSHLNTSSTTPINTSMNVPPTTLVYPVNQETLQMQNLNHNLSRCPIYQLDANQLLSATMINPRQDPIYPRQYFMMPRSQSGEVNSFVNTGCRLFESNNSRTIEPGVFHQIDPRLNNWSQPYDSTVFSSNKEPNNQSNSFHLTSSTSAGASVLGSSFHDMNLHHRTNNCQLQPITYHNNSFVFDPSKHAGNSYTIGRALGQAYLQRLQRKPNIFAVDPNSLDQSKPMNVMGQFAASSNRINSTIGIHQNSCEDGGHPHAVIGTLDQPFGSSFDRQPRIINPDQFSVQCNNLTNRRTRSQTLLHNQDKLYHSRYRSSDTTPSDDQHDIQPNQFTNAPIWGEPSKCQTNFPHKHLERHQKASRDDQIRTLQRHRIQHQPNIVETNTLSCNKFIEPKSRATKSSDSYRGSKSKLNISTNNQAQQSSANDKSVGRKELAKLIYEVDKAIQNAMFIAQHIDNLDEFESVKENWKYIAMVVDRIFLIVFLFACIVGSVAIFAMVPWSWYIYEKPIDLDMLRHSSMNATSMSSPQFIVNNCKLH